MADATKLVRPIAVVRLAPGGAGESRQDEVAVEEPLEIRIAGDTFAVTMRTPGHDRELALGLLLAEGVIRTLDDVGAIVPCGAPGELGYGNSLDVRPAPGTALVLPDERRRGTLTTAACGVCGRTSIDDLIERCGVLPAIEPLPLQRLLDAIARLHEHQPGFARSGGLHAALATDAAGRVLAAAEDVGRHNAVDKVAGSLLLSGAHARAHVLAVSGRIGFEIVQKAVASAIPFVCGVSAPSSLAVELAERCGVVLAGFVRGDTLALYAHADRVALALPRGPEPM